MKKIYSFVFLLFFVFSVNAFANAVVVDKIVATVEGVPITAYELTNIAGFYNTKDANTLINLVVDDYVIMHYAKNVGITVDDEDVDNFVEELAKRNGLDKDAFLKKVKASGVDMNYYFEGIKLQIYKQKFAGKMFARSIKISKADIQRYYVLHKDMLKQDNVLIMSIIATKDKKIAQAVYKELSQGGDFEKLKMRYSMDKSKQKAIPASVFNKQIRDKLLGLKKGEYSSIIESNGVFYIAKLIGKQSMKDSKELIDNRIKNILFAKKVESKLSSWLKMVKVRTDIEIFE